MTTHGAVISNHIIDSKYVWFLYFNRGYASIPTGVYFNSEFSIVTRIRIGSTSNTDKWSRIIEFGAGKTLDNIILTLNDGESLA